MSSIEERRKDILETNELLNSRLKDIEELYRELHHHIEVLSLEIKDDENLLHLSKIERNVILMHKQHSACMQLVLESNERGLDSLITYCLGFLEEKVK